MRQPPWVRWESIVATLRQAGAGTGSEQELRHRLVEQGRLVRIASSFVHLPPGQVDDGIDAALAELGSIGGGRPGWRSSCSTRPATP